MKVSEKCTGCCACMNICPKNAIEMIENEEKALVPRIDKTLCTNCLLCQKICPMNNTSEFNEPIECYAAWAKSKDERETSTSGGIASAISQYYIDNKGIVYGTAFNEDMEVQFIRVDMEKDLFKLKGSKYVYSYPGNIYKQIKKDLIEKKQVLFIGLPCQIDGLKFYLKNKYSNLITIDLVCHGVPPYKYLKEYIDKICKNIKINNIQFRDNERYDMKFKIDSRVVKKSKYERDLYLYPFCNSIILRDNCYSCRYSNKMRISDLTIGDFWGLGKKIPFEYNKEKVSLILINTSNGQELINKLDNYIFKFERDKEEAISGNGQLMHPSKGNKYNIKFKTFIREYDYYTAIKKSGVQKKMFLDRQPKIVRQIILFFKKVMLQIFKRN